MDDLARMLGLAAFVRANPGMVQEAAAVNDDLIERLAHKARMQAITGGLYYASLDDLVRFAALVAEECAKRCEGVAVLHPNPGDAARLNWAQAAEYAAGTIRAEFGRP